MESFTCLVLFTAAFTLTVRCQLPQIVEDIFSEAKRKSDTGYLNCTVSRQQNNEVMWIKLKDGPNNTWISKDTDILATNREENGTLKYEVIRRYRDTDIITYTLVVHRLLEEDSGIYMCYIYLPGKHQSQWPFKYGYMTVQVPPTIVVSKTSNTIERHQGNDVSLTCNVTGTPTPNIFWIRPDGKFLHHGRLSHRGHVLNIKNLKKYDNGVYRCLADNKVNPPASHDVKLVVFFKPEATAFQDTVGQAQNRRSHAILECNIQGMPEPTLRWYLKTDRGVKALTNNEKFVIKQFLNDDTSLQLNSVQYSLKILNVQAYDYTTYYCEGENRLGKSQAEIRLYETNGCQGPDCPPVGATDTASALLSNLSLHLITLFMYLCYKS